jgi:prepilin-type N-terminal cleavage/methylation domain-containing protein
MKWHRFNFRHPISNFKSEISNLRAARRGFSLVEVLLAIFILGIGMIMVASVFPVGANWTRQTAETSVAQNVAQNAVTVIKRHYGVNGDLRDFLSPEFYSGPNVFIGSNSVLRSSGLIPGFGIPYTPYVVQPLPGFERIPATERGYLFGNSEPFPVPASKLTSCTYFWTALIRLNPSHRRLDNSANETNGVRPSSSYTYDLYILVFHKGSAEQTFNDTPNNVPAGYLRALGTQTVVDPATNNPTFIPQIPAVAYATYTPGQYDSSRTPSVFNAYPPMGQFGIGARTGTVFRQTLDLTDPSNLKASPRPLLEDQPAKAAPSEPIIFAPAADGTANTASPLIYIYQTTLTF